MAEALGMSGYLNKSDREADLIVLDAARANAVQAGAAAIVKFMLRPEAQGMPAAAMAVHLSHAVVAAAIPFLAPMRVSMSEELQRLQEERSALERDLDAARGQPR